MISNHFIQKATSGVLLFLFFSLGSIGLTKELLSDEQGTIKMQTVKWREIGGNSTNTSDLIFTNSFPDQAWWGQFQDSYLSSYIQQAISANLSLAIAYERIDEARSLARQNLGREFPQVSLGNFASHYRNSVTSLRTSRSNTQNNNGSTGGTSAFALDQTINNFSVPLNVSYEVDIWGKNINSTRAANKQAEAVKFDFKAMKVIVATDVANAYFNLLAADQLIVLQQKILETAESDLIHAQRLFEAGVTDEENVVLRQGRLTDFKAELQNFYKLQALALNQLAILMGQTPDQVAGLQRARWEQYNIPAEVATGIPSELIARRPDILAAESRLAASGFQVEVARKQMFPSINLNGQLGFASPSLSSLFNWESHIASAAASLVQYLFTGSQGRANLRVYQSRYEQQLYSYRDTILQSFQEVDDSLASLNAHRNAYREYTASLELLEKRQQIQQNRFQAGAIAQADINPVRLEVLQAQLGLAQTKLASITDVLSLYKALGGGY